MGRNHLRAWIEEPRIVSDGRIGCQGPSLLQTNVEEQEYIMEDIIMQYGNLSFFQVKKVVAKFLTKDTVNYRKLTHQPMDAKNGAVTGDSKSVEDSDQSEIKERELAQGLHVFIIFCIV